MGELGGEHADEVIDVGTGGGLPLPHGAVQSQHDLLDQRIRAAQFLGEFHRLTAAVRFLEGRVAEIEVDGVEAPLEFDIERATCRVDEEPPAGIRWARIDRPDRRRTVTGPLR
ncbi:hypothetical protein HEP87_57995 [Streptomyces sp. S1D4-11]